MLTRALLAIPSSSLQHTIGHIDCPACEADRLALIQNTELKLLKFREAAEVCLRDEIGSSLKPRTHDDHVAFTRRLNHFFADIVLEKIHEGHIFNYQKERAKTAGAELINHEVSWLGHVLESAGLWAALKLRVKRLKVQESEAGHALTPEERERLLVCAGSEPRWRVAFLCSLLTVNTGVGPGEIRHIRVKYVDMRNRTLGIMEGVKNDYRMRYVPMDDTIAWICNELLRRHYKICERQETQPDEDFYLLPFLQTAARRGQSISAIKGGSYDLTRPMGSWRSAWESLRKKADLPKLRMYDLRHTVATEWMEDPNISQETIEALMGHATKRMKKRYAHIRDKAKLEALQRHEVPPPRLLEVSEGRVELLPRPPVTVTVPPSGHGDRSAGKSKK